MEPQSAVVERGAELVRVVPLRPMSASDFTGWPLCRAAAAYTARIGKTACAHGTLSPVRPWSPNGLWYSGQEPA